MSDSSPTLAQLDAKRTAPSSEVSNNKHLPKPDAFSKFLILEGWSHWFFRFGFASIFLMNAIYAIYEPSSFAGVLEENPIASSLGMTDVMVKTAITNDIILSVFIIGGWRKRFVYAWAGIWLLLIAGLKLTNLIF